MALYLGLCVAPALGAFWVLTTLPIQRGSPTLSPGARLQGLNSLITPVSKELYSWRHQTSQTCGGAHHCLHLRKKKKSTAQKACESYGTQGLHMASSSPFQPSLTPSWTSSFSPPHRCFPACLSIQPLFVILSTQLKHGPLDPNKRETATMFKLLENQ